MTNPGRNSSLRRLGDDNPTRIGPAGLAVPVPAASPTGGPHTVCAAIKSPTHRRAVASRPAPRGRSGHRPPPPRPQPALRRGLLSPVSTFGVRNPQAQSAPGGSRQVGEDRAPSTTVDGDPPWLPPALLPTIPGLLWFGTNEESVEELMLACPSPCASTREGIEEAAWEAYSKGRGRVLGAAPSLVLGALVIPRPSD